MTTPVSTMDLWAELDGVRIDGCDTTATYGILADSIGGLGFGETRSVDLERVGDDGAESGTDRQQTRVVTIPVVIKAETPGGDGDPREAMRALRLLKRAWRPTGDEQMLRVGVPGVLPDADEVVFFGRPRGTMEVVLSRLAGGIVYARCTFHALDPRGYGAAETQSGSGTFTLTNDGDDVTPRAVLTLTGNGGTPTVTNNTDGGGAVGWSVPLANGAERLINLRTLQVTDGGGVDRAGEIASASTWFVLQPGANELVVSGGGAVEATLRPGYL